MTTRCYQLIPLVLIIALCSLCAQAEEAAEYEVKAVFLYNICKFVEWPDAAFDNQDSPLVIGIVGEDPFGRFLDSAVANQKVRGRRFTVKRFRKLKDLESSHVLFISESEKKYLKQIFTETKGRHVLLIGDTYKFAKHGGTVNFITKNNRVSFEINLNTARESDLKISSKLLRLAHKVYE